MNGNCTPEKDICLQMGLSVDDDKFEFLSDISKAISNAESELQDTQEQLEENIEKVRRLTPECDKLDYALAASSGVLCGVIDVFLVGKLGESPLENITDKWFENRTKDFAKLCGWNSKGNPSASSAIKYLENKFKIPYDQRGAGDAASWIFNLTPKNHHFKSLAHNPSLLGLFFSILDQFANTSHFVSEGELISLQEADGKFELRGNNSISKLFCGFANWIGHLVSDMTGSSGSKGRGMGIPSPLWCWTNDIITIKSKLHIPVSEFDKSVNNLALQIYEKGYDTRFQTTQGIPVLINELLVRLMYSIRRFVKYISTTKAEERSLSLLWKTCEPFSNVSVKRILTVAHGTFCLIDVGDAVIRGFITGGGYFNVVEFFLRLNIVGVGRLSISLYGEMTRTIRKSDSEIEIYFLERKAEIINYYIDGLKLLSEIYDDSSLLSFIDDFEHSDLYMQAFDKSVELAKKRNVPDDKVLKTKADIDKYFMVKKDENQKKTIKTKACSTRNPRCN